MTYIRCQSHVILGLSMGLRPPCLYPSTRTIILKGHPMSLSEANSFQFTWGEPTRGVCGLHSINTSVFIPVRFLSMSYSTTWVRFCQGKNDLFFTKSDNFHQFLDEIPSIVGEQDTLAVDPMFNTLSMIEGFPICHPP